MYTNYLAWLLLVPFILSLAAFALRWFRKQVNVLSVVEIIHLISISAVLVLALAVVQGVL